MQTATIAAIALTIAGCGGGLMPTPNIYVDGAYALYGDLDPALRSTTIDLLYATDRAPIVDDGALGYGHRRSRAVAFGSSLVEIGSDLSWEALLRESTARQRSRKLSVRVKSVTEQGRFPETPELLVERDGQLVEDPALRAQGAAAHAKFASEVRRRLALTPSKDVFVYVHGFHNSFDYASAVLAEFWHFGGRIGVPILYSWPAGAPGMLRGYTHDRESGEFTIHHLKRFLRLIASIPEVERVHVIAHSRGTGVATSALQDLLIEDLAAGRDSHETLRISNLVLASPDLDLDVFFQRFFGEQFFRVAKHVTLYVSQKDKALGLSQWLFSDRRLGEVEPRDFADDEAAILRHIDTYDIVDAKVRTGSVGHSYYHSSPAVSSDLILLLRYGAKAGSPRRPLGHSMTKYWILDDEAYPFAKKQ